MDAEKSKGNVAGFTLSQLMRQTKIRHAFQSELKSIHAIAERLFF